MENKGRKRKRGDKQKKGTTKKHPTPGWKTNIRKENTTGKSIYCVEK